MKYYLFNQNNSGGYNIGPPNIIIKCNNLTEAESIAFKNGVYYDGVIDGRDCDCCGDRWSSPEVFDSLDVLQYYTEDIKTLIIDSKKYYFDKEVEDILGNK